MGKSILTEENARPLGPGEVRIRVENAYVCGRISHALHVIAGPTPADGLDTWWEESEAYDLTGDGHSCGSSENAIYEVTIIESRERPELVGESREWG